MKLSRKEFLELYTQWVVDTLDRNLPDKDDLLNFLVRANKMLIGHVEEIAEGMKESSHAQAD